LLNKAKIIIIIIIIIIYLFRVHPTDLKLYNLKNIKHVKNILQLFIYHDSKQTWRVGKETPYPFFTYQNTKSLVYELKAL